MFCLANEKTVNVHANARRYVSSKESFRLLWSN